MTVSLKTWRYEPSRGGDIVVSVGNIAFDPSLPKTPEEAAKSLYAALRAYAVEAGFGDTSVMLWNPVETAKRRKGYYAWCVCWEGGPFEWATLISMDLHGPWGYTEPYYSFDLTFVH